MAIFTAFLIDDLDKEIYVHSKQGYCCLLQNGRRYNHPKLTKTSWKIVLCLRKSLCGLYQPSQVWYRTFQNFVDLIEFMASQADGGLLMHNVEAQGIVISAIVLYINDLLVFAIEVMIGMINN